MGSIDLNIHNVLQQYWGYSNFRPLQEDIILSVLSGKDTLALMPTGGGKSICFQVPAMAKDGICVVVTPLIALMKDQVENLKSRGIQAQAIYSGMTYREVDIALDNCIYGSIKFLYLSPERLQSELVQERIRHMNVNLYAIDEAHCISQWGYDFRPPYLLLTLLRELHPRVPFLALTATATAQVVEDIQDKLGFRERNVLKKSFYRDNLAYMVLEEEDKPQRMLNIIRKIGGCGIVYVRNRRETQETARFLVNEGVSADFYHAGLAADLRSKKQEQWKSDKVRVIVATNAFGMGIDKPDVRFVIHLEPPDSLEAYYQEAGRAGRDGKKSYAVLLARADDLLELERRFEESYPPIDYIRKVYQYVFNFFQIGYGAGEGLTLDFDIGAFCTRFHLTPVPVLQAFKFLERDGWLRFSESVFLPSRIKIITSPSDLYKFQVENQLYDSLIKRILRMYGGAFDHYVPIREYDLARALETSYGLIVERLQALQQLEVIEYLPQTDSPQVQLLRERMDNLHLHLDADFIRSRKEIQRHKLFAVRKYLQVEYCRSRQLLAYFDETNTSNCGQCDVCLRREKSKSRVKKGDLERFRLWLNTNLTTNSGRSLEEIVESYHKTYFSNLSDSTAFEGVDEQHALDLLRIALAEGWLREGDGLYWISSE